ncbi:hypothetical protein RRF57_002031 [Xylaria bambusicola]|uniref:Uncharacterized protein n=1 Tax=Xylaria bambusicola TaxID=326684 RepID=A0AAN7Z6M0_9PEZI
MSIATHPQEQQHPEGVNSAARPSETLSSVCIPPRPVTSSKQDASGVSSNVRQLTSPPSPTITARHGSSDTGREQVTPTWLPTVSQSQLEHHFSKQGMDGIFRNVRTFLAAKRHGKLAATTSDENDKPSSPIQTTPDIRYLEPPEDQYLITTDDIAGILDIVVAGVCSIHDDKGQPDCRSLLFARGQRAKPTLRVENIIPGEPAVAGPTTTFCSPRPCFNSSDGLGGSQPPPSAPKINWELFSDVLNRNDNAEPDNLGVEARESPKSSPSHGLPSRHVSWPQSRQLGRRKGVGIDSSPRFLNSPRRFRQPGQRSTSEPFSQQPLQNDFNYVVATTPITSFPRLKSRSCTNDWLTPLENDASAERREMVSDLYIRGIDAHSGDSSYKPLPILEEASQSNSTPPLQAQGQDYQSHIHVYEKQWSSQASEYEMDCRKKRGRSIGVACHKRIRVREQLDQRPDQSSPPLKGSSGSRSGSGAPDIDRSPDPMQQGQLRAASCSEDAAPHVCVDEQRTDQISP